MRWLLVLALVSACRSPPTSPGPAPTPARIAAVPRPAPALTPEPVVELAWEELPWVDPDEPEVGAIAGVIVDPAGEAIPGVTIIVTTSSANYGMTAITEEDGGFTIEDLAPDDYIVTMYYADQTFEHHVHVDDKLVEVAQAIDPDLGTTYIGCGGVAMENTYVVDGIDTTGLTFGE